MEARRLALAAVAALALAGCGGDGDGEEAAQPTTGAPAAGCSDAAFRNQAEELYVVQATAQNAAAGSAGAVELADQLEAGIAALRGYLEAHPPCADELRDLAERERGALDRLDAALVDLRSPTGTAPDDVRVSLDEARAELAAVERELVGAP